MLVVSALTSEGRGVLWPPLTDGNTTNASASLDSPAATIAAADTPLRFATYGEMLARMRMLAITHPGVVRLYSTQEEFGLPSVGECDEAATAGDAAAPAPCRVWVMDIGRRAGAALLSRPSMPSTVPPPSPSFEEDAARPAVLVSGEVHGDEVVGPSAAIAFAELLAGAASPSNESAAFPTDPVLRAWLRRLLDDRVVTVVPMANAIGFETGVRGEDQSSPGGLKADPLDPNRDFAFNVNGSTCMRTVTARSINELFRSRLYTLLLTLHGGTNAIGYEWGDWGHCPRPPPDAPPPQPVLGGGPVCEPAPDAAAMHGLGDRLSSAAGTGGVQELYPVGNTGTLIYPVGGGMEDWAYGASWSRDRGVEAGSVVCTPSTLGGYPAERTTADNSTYRCVTYLIETSTDKKPKEATLGSVEAVGHLRGGGQGDGHVPRNVRLMVAAVDGVGVAVDIVSVGGVRVEPAASLWPPAPFEADAPSASGTDVEFYVGGALSVDAATLHVSTPAGVAAPAVTAVGPVNGTGGTPATPGTRFRLTLPPLPAAPCASGGSTGSAWSPPLYVRVAARVDAHMAATHPQSHLVNARVDGHYRHTVGATVVQGRAVWYSRTLRVTGVPRADCGGRGAAPLEVVDVTGTIEGEWGGQSLTLPRGAAE